MPTSVPALAAAPRCKSERRVSRRVERWISQSSGCAVSTAAGCPCGSATSRAACARSWLIPPRSGAPVPSHDTLSVQPMPNAACVARASVWLHLRDTTRYVPAVRSLDSLTADDFIALRGQRFSISADDLTPSDAELVKVTEVPREPGGREPFSVVFQGGPSPPLPQRIYRVEQQQLGPLEIFLVPIAAYRYEAVFA